MASLTVIVTRAAGEMSMARRRVFRACCMAMSMDPAAELAVRTTTMPLMVIWRGARVMSTGASPSSVMLGSVTTRRGAASHPSMLANHPWPGMGTSPSSA